jgi:hypothetical protein
MSAKREWSESKDPGFACHEDRKSVGEMKPL